MTIIVVDPGSGDGESGARGSEERRILLCGTMVGNLEDISTKVHSGGQNRLLARRLYITGEQQPEAPHLDHDHQTAVILFRRLILIDGHMVDWAEHLQLRLPNAGAGTGERRVHRNALVRSLTADH